MGLRLNREPAAAPAPAPSPPKVAASRSPSAPAADKERVAARKPVAPVPATITFAILPWGEVHIDGKMHGISPPLHVVELAPGRHRIEIRNAHFPPYVEIVDAKAGSRIRIGHKFQN